MNWHEFFAAVKREYLCMSERESSKEVETQVYGEWVKGYQVFKLEWCNDRLFIMLKPKED